MSSFFFQAEDGIRDGHVTGVQTCALPISADRPHDHRDPAGPGAFRGGDRLAREDPRRPGADRRRYRPDGGGEVPGPHQMRAVALEGLSGRPGRGPHPGAAMSAAATGNGAARTLGELVGLLEDTYPLDWAESWDRVGLVLGERSAGVDRVLLAVDPTLEVAREAVETGSDLLITHHPLLLRGASFLPADEGKGAVVTTLLRAGTGLWCGHTNVDRSTLGTVGAWARALDLQDSRPLVPPAAEAEGAHGSRLF